MAKNALKKWLDEKLVEFNRPEFIISDPIVIPHMFSLREDIEIAAFLTATIAWGRRTTIIRNARKLMEMMDFSPHQFIMHFTEKDLIPFRNFVHRTFNGQDCQYFLWALKNIFQQYGTLENAFAEGGSNQEKNTFHSIMRLRTRFLQLDPCARASRHISNPAANSSAKRINMFLRWMVRNDHQGIDFGLWHRIGCHQLICPLDVHTGAVARRLGLLKRTANDWKAAEELTETLKKFDPVDPVKYDIALFGIGISNTFWQII